MIEGCNVRMRRIIDFWVEYNSASMHEYNIYRIYEANLFYGNLFNSRCAKAPLRIASAKIEELKIVF